ncbi:MAG TPA: tRNA (adenosine(37)-N6)-threonylcarbamoyltransferase complex ATPase subunit type 1 TsaE [Candidatus Prevotella avicola]|uniref:tRNA threonylcarbamoyladenosine biosynthesis protein TsaE n=1 Tax=Candidatus Prevotella avicola TaxID=2838738 RepID=A0A9D2FY08_9BACT|nr:tRNA (adenosine(37)-N6)-threonylcarbamoyltransferase complex ATPase subunit type 1 TsaE [Candidatus Prevotella avicola]
MRIEIPSVDKIQEAARQFVCQMGDAKVFAFYGKMGAGKTTFIKAICQELGVEDVITSPTFALVNEYTAGDGSPIFHFDFYRVKKLEEVYDMGYEDYFYSGALCLMEWPELVEELLPQDAVAVTIHANADGSRSIDVER